MESNKYLIVAVLALMAGLMLRSCLGRQPVTQHPLAVAGPLPSTDTLRVGMQGHTIAVQTASGIEERYVPEEGRATIEVKKDGTEVVTVKNKGFTRQFGATVFVADSVRGGLDCEIAYWNRLGLFVGGGFGRTPLFAGFVGLGYQLDQLRLNNTSLWVGYTTTKNPAVGVRVAF